MSPQISGMNALWHSPYDTPGAASFRTFFSKLGVCGKLKEKKDSLKNSTITPHALSKL